jgi:NitT/TauT family transport system permease protein
MASMEQRLTLADGASVVRQHTAPVVRTGHVLNVLRRYGPGVALVALFLLSWELAPRFNWVEPSLLPPFSAVVACTLEMIKNGQLWANTAESLTRSLLGFGLAIVIAVPLGLVIGWSRSVARTIQPLLELFRCTPALALLPVFILLLGIGETSKIALVLYACSWPILLNTISAVRNVDPLLVKSARTMGVSQAQLLWKVMLPAAVPTIFAGFRLAGAVSLVALVAAEMLGAKAGLGYMIQYSQYNFQIPQMYVGIIAIALLGLAMTQALAAVERRILSWQPPAESSEAG